MKWRNVIVLIAAGLFANISSFYTTNFLCNTSCKVCEGLDIINPFCQAAYTSCMASLGACGVAANILALILFWGGTVLIILGIFQIIMNMIAGK